jgi:hypothetical protein
LAANAVAASFDWKDAKIEITRLEKAILRHLEEISDDFRTLVEKAKQ